MVRKYLTANYWLVYNIVIKTLEEIIMTFSNNNENKKLISIEELSDKEIELIDEEFFNENPQYAWIKERNIQNAKIFKTSNWVKLFMFLGIAFALVGLLCLLLQNGKGSLFKVFIVLAGICLVALFIADKIDGVKTDKSIDKMKEYVESPEFKEYEKAIDNWYNSKGYYIPNDEDDEE